MKKLIYIFTILSSCLIFNTVFSNCSKDQYNKVDNLADAIAYENDEDIYNITYNLGDTSKEIEKRYNLLYDFIKEREETAIVSYGIQDGFLINHMQYIYCTQNLNDFDFFKTKDGQMMDFENPSNKYITSNKDDLQAFDHIQYINQEYGKSYQDKTILKQFLSFLNDIDVNKHNDYSIVVNIVSKDVTQLATEIATSDLHNYVEDLNNTIEYEGISFTEMNQSFVLIVIILASMASVILFICQIFKSKKEIVIRKMFGQNSLYIFNRLFLKQISHCLLFYFALQILIYFFKIGNLSEVNIVVIRECILIYLYYISFMVLAAVCVLGAVHKSDSYLSMKKSGNIKLISYGSLLLKMVFIILVMSPFVGSLFLVKDVVKEAYTLYTNAEYMNGDIIINSIKSNNYEITKNLIMHFYDGNGGVFQDFGKNFENEEIKKYTASGYSIDMLYPHIVANPAYLKDYHLRTIEGETINVNNLKDQILLVPEKYRNKDMSPYCTNCSAIIVQNGNEYVSHNAFTYDNFSMLSKKDPIILLVKDAKDWNGNYLFLKNTEKNRSKLNQYLKDNKLEDSLLLSTNDINYQMAKEENQDNLINILILFGIYIALTLVFQYQSIYIYFSEHKNLFAINYLLGKNFLQRYIEIFSLNVLVYSIPFIYGMVKTKLTLGQLSLFVLSAMMIDCIIAYFMIHHFERQNIIKILKGDN